MTEQEAIKILTGIDEVHGNLPEDGNDVEATLMMARDALEEVQQYRALGTVEELREAMKKQRAKKILKRKCVGRNKDCANCDDYANRCPTCKETVDNDYMIEYTYCPYCGQALDWSEEIEP